MSHDLLLPVSGAALGIVGLVSIPALGAITKQVRNGAPKDNFYEDRDGKSTPEAMAAFSNKWPKIIGFIFSATGFGTSITFSVLETINRHQHDLFLPNWLTAASWTLILLQEIILFSIHQPLEAYGVGTYISFSAVVTAISVVLQAFDVGPHVQSVDPSFICRLVNVASVLIVCVVNLLIPRRPDVYFRDEVVDRQWTVSWLGRLTWSWPRPLMDLGAKKLDLVETDVPQPDSTIRTKEVMTDWKNTNYQGRLLWALFWNYRRRIAKQSAVTILRAILGVGPFYVMLSLINALELRGGGGNPTSELWGLVIALTFFSMGEQWLDSWANWHSINFISQPMRAQLSALIYEKSLRRKDVKSADASSTETKPEAEVEIEAEVGDGQDAPDAITADEHGAVGDGEAADPVENANGETTSKNDDKAKKEAPISSSDSSVLKSRQAVVNLVGVDTKRISQFAAMQFLIISSFGKLTVYSVFLILLIGWIPFGCGLLAWALVIPVNTHFSKRYLRLATELMKLRDEKLAIVNEALLGIRQIKFAALEKQWEKRIMDKREEELQKTWGVFLGDTVLFALWVISPILLAAASLASYALLNGGLSAGVAFTAISIFKALEVTLGFLPEILSTGFDTIVSVDRIDTYLKGPELTQVLSEGPYVAFENATIAWPVDDETPEESRFVLRNLDVTFPHGELSVVSGKTGTGKSLVLSSLLGETDVLSGSIYVPSTVPILERNDANAHPGNWIVPGSVAYVAQTPWLEGASVKDNITFGLPLIDSRYKTVLDVCALKKDIEILVDGDKTMLGANGVNLSGGQKWRVSLARAIYSRAEILIMDDIFSAVDAHVGRQIFEKCIGGDICKGRTRILVTHHLGLVQPLTKFVVELGEGKVNYAGMTEDLIKEGKLQETQRQKQALIALSEDETAEASTAVASEEASEAGNGDNSSKKDDTGAAKFVQDETRETGFVKSRVYSIYMQDTGGWIFWIICAIFYVGFEAGNLSRAWWVRIWTGSSSQSVGAAVITEPHNYSYGFTLQDTAFHAAAGSGLYRSQTDGNKDLGFYLWIYIALSFAMCAMGAARFWWSFLMSIRASRTMFQRILVQIMRTPLRWLDTVPVGRILNRLTSDFEVIDQRLTIDLGMLFWHVLSLGGVCVAGLLVSVYILPLAFVLVIAAGIVGKKYLDGARPLKRLESTSKSPVFEHFNVTLAGISTVRAFQKTSTFIDRMYKDLDLWDCVSIYMYNSNRWLAFRMAMVGSSFTTLMGVVVILSPRVDAAMAGFTISFALDFSMNMLLAIRNYSSLELDMNSAERIVEYSEVATEDQGGEKPPAAWPTSGTMEVEDLEVSYAPELPPVLKGVSFKVKDNERIGVVGRTGAGKSSLTLALFRFLEARAGTIRINGLDVSKIDLHSLRSRLAIIPQDPVLFSGTIRSNLDPFNNRTDDELRDCLERVHLMSPESGTLEEEPSDSEETGPQNINIFHDLKSPVSESGGNLSQGQRQLLCLARAIVSRPKIMVLDEATSAVDMATDHLIQRSIREEFTNSTLLVIAHRLSTIVDFDRILVLNEGTVAEFGTPRELWEKEDSIFREMCNSSGEKEKLEDTIFGSV